MANHHDHDHSNEQKPVAFTVPLILAIVTLTIILALTSLGDPCSCTGSEECAESCQKGGHSEHHAAATHEEKAGTNEGENKETEEKSAAPTDVPTAEPAKEEHH